VDLDPFDNQAPGSGAGVAFGIDTVILYVVNDNFSTNHRCIYERAQRHGHGHAAVVDAIRSPAFEITRAGTR